MEFATKLEIQKLFDFDGFAGGGKSDDVIKEVDKHFYMNDVNEMLCKSPELEGNIAILDELEMLSNDEDFELIDELPIYGMYTQHAQPYEVPPVLKQRMCSILEAVDWSPDIRTDNRTPNDDDADETEEVYHQREEELNFYSDDRHSIEYKHLMYSNLNSAQNSSSLANALKQKNTLMRRENSQMQINFKNKFIRTSIYFYPYSKSNAYEEYIPSELTIADIIQFLLQKYYGFPNTSSIKLQMFEIRLIDEEDGFPDLDLMPLNYNREFGKLHVKEIALCFKDEELENTLVFECPKYGSHQLNDRPPLSAVEEKQFVENVDESPSSVYSYQLSAPDDGADLGKLGEDIEIRQKPLECSEDDKDSFENSFSSMGILRRGSFASTPQPQQKELHDRQPDDSKTFVLTSNYFDDFDYNAEEGVESDVGVYVVNEEVKASDAAQNRRLTSMKSVHTFRTPNSSSYKTVSRVTAVASAGRKWGDMGSWTASMNKCISAHTDDERERVFTVVTPEYASKRFEMDANRLKGKAGPDGVKEIVVVAVLQNSRVFELCAKVAKAMKAETLSHLAFEGLKGGNALDMGARVSSISVDEQVLVIFRQNTTSTQSQPVSTIIEKRPPLAMFIYTEYTATAITEYSVSYQPLNEIKGSYHVADVQKAILTIDGERIYHTLQPSEDLKQNRMPAYSFAASSSVAINSSQSDAFQPKAPQSGFFRPLLRKLSGQHLNWLSTSSKQKIKYPPLEQYIWEILAVYVEPTRQCDFFIVYPEKLGSPYSRAVFICYAAETPTACAEIVAKLTFLMFHINRN